MNSIEHLNGTNDSKELIPFADRLEGRLSAAGALNLLAVAIRIAPRDEALELMLAAMHDFSSGPPLPSFVSIAEEAKDWAAFATLVERKNYAAAIFNTFSANERAAFLGFADRMAA